MLSWRIMKSLTKSLLLTLLTFSQFSWATSLSELDQRQKQLGDHYSSLVKELPSAAGLQQAILANDKETVLNASQKITAFFKAYDDFNLDKIDFFQDSLIARAEAELTENEFTPKKAGKKLQEMKDVRAKYLILKPLFGSQGDMKRLDVGQQFLPAYGEFAKDLRKSWGERPWRNFGQGKIVPFIDTFPDFLKVSGKFAKLLWSAYFRSHTGVPDRAPIPEALAGTQRKLVQMRDIETKWEGLENVGDVTHDGKTLHMFLINHGNSFLDTSAQQAFPIPGMSSMGDVDIFFPGFLARRMAQSDHMIAVGHGDTTGKAIDLVHRKQLNRFFLAVEGITGTGLYEMRPVMPMFSAAVYESIQRGLELKLHPVAFPDNFRLMNDWRAPIEGPKPSRGIVLPAITNDVCIKLKELTQREIAIGELIRWNWFATLKNDESKVLAMPYPTEISRRLEQMVWLD